MSDARIFTPCTEPGCRRTGKAPEWRAAVWRCPDHRPSTPEPATLDWPRLMALAEAKGAPVSRVDTTGAVHILRTVRQLEEEWE